MSASEAPAIEPVPSSSEPLEVSMETAGDGSDHEDEGPSAKKRKTEKEGPASDKLEHRLGGILCCSVCLDLPSAAVYQCANGHLMCAPCFMHLLADARLRDENATCPNCRVEISKMSASRNLAVEKTVSELPSECKFCTRVFPRHSLAHHEGEACEDREFKYSQLVVAPQCGKPRWSALEGLVRIVSGVSHTLWALWASALALPASARPRPRIGARASSTDSKRRRRLTRCQYACIGCPWRGPWHELRAHVAACAHPNKSAADVVAVLAERDRRASDDMLVFNQIFDLLSYEKITFTDLQLKPYRTEEFVHKLYYESSRFAALCHNWVVKAFVNKNQRDPTQSSTREITYQLILKSKSSVPLSLQWVVLRGPYSETRVGARVTHHVFTDDTPDAPPQPLPLRDPPDTNRLLSNRAIHFRLIMFLSSK